MYMITKVLGYKYEHESKNVEFYVVLIASKIKSLSTACDYPPTSPDYRQTDKHLGRVMTLL